MEKKYLKNGSILICLIFICTLASTLACWYQYCEAYIETDVSVCVCWRIVCVCVMWCTVLLQLGIQRSSLTYFWLRPPPPPTPTPAHPSLPGLPTYTSYRPSTTAEGNREKTSLAKCYLYSCWYTQPLCSWRIIYTWLDPILISALLMVEVKLGQMWHITGHKH